MKKYGMDATAVDKQVAALREADTAVAGRLAELDSKLSEWLSAMRSAEAGLRASAERVASLAAATPVVAGPPPAAPEAKPAPEVPAAAVETEAASSAPEARRTRGRVAVPSAAATTSPPPAEPETPAVPKPKAVAPPAEAAVEAPPADNAASAAAEDEALLAQLDPETANALRVKRRLTGNRKSIRQLLDEMNAAGGAAANPPPGKSKRWWR